MIVIKKIRNITFFLLLLFLIGITLLQIGTRIFNNQFHYDEAYNIQIPLHLKSSFQYATFDSVFDMNITTGPTVLIPAAFFYHSSHPTLPRVVTAIYSLIFLIYILKNFFTNRIEKIFYLILINITPLFFLFSTVILGEIPGFVLLFFCYIALSRSKYLVAGLLLALSIITKNIYILGVFPLIIQLILAFYNTKTIPFKYYKRFFIGFIAVFIIWGLYTFYQFNFNLSLYSQYLSDAVSFTRSRGHYQLGAIEKRFSMIAYTLNIGGAFFIFMMLFIAGFVGIKNKQFSVRSLSIFTIVYLLYYVLFGATNWYRHFFPSILSFLLIIPYFIRSFFETFNFERKLIATVFVILLMISVVNFKYRDKNAIFTKLLIEQDLLFLDQTNEPYFRQKKILSDQYQMAAFIKNNISPTEKISGFVWLNSPEIAYLTNRRIYRDPEEDDVQYVISSIYDRILDPKAKIIMENLLLDKIYSNDTYVLYKKNTLTFSKTLISRHDIPLYTESMSEKTNGHVTICALVHAEDDKESLNINGDFSDKPSQFF